MPITQRLIAPCCKDKGLSCGENGWPSRDVVRTHDERGKAILQAKAGVLSISSFTPRLAAC
jgi:hypothetical protein